MDLSSSLASASASTSSCDGSSSSSSIDASLLQMVHDNHLTNLRLRDFSEKAKKDAMKRAMRMSDLLVNAVNGGVQQSFINQKRIELEIRALAATIARFQKQSDHWLAASHSINSAIKEIGDFENWMKTMDFDCRSINAAIRNIHQACIHVPFVPVSLMDCLHQFLKPIAFVKRNNDTKEKGSTNVTIITRMFASASLLR